MSLELSWSVWVYSFWDISLVTIKASQIIRIDENNMSHVTVHQIHSKSINNRAFMNVQEADLYVKVWTHIFERPTYVIRDGLHIMLIQFVDKESANEWLEDHADERFQMFDVSLWAFQNE